MVDPADPVDEPLPDPIVQPEPRRSLVRPRATPPAAAEATSSEPVVESTAVVIEAPAPVVNKRGRNPGKLAQFGTDYLRSKLSTMSVPDAAITFGVSQVTIYKYRKALGIGAQGKKPSEAEVVERKSFTDYSDLELREMLSTRTWSSIAFDHGVSITGVITEAKRLGVKEPAKAPVEVSRKDSTFRISSSDRAADVHA